MQHPSHHPHWPPSNGPPPQGGGPPNNGPPPPNNGGSNHYYPSQQQQQQPPPNNGNGGGIFRRPHTPNDHYSGGPPPQQQGYGPPGEYFFIGGITFYSWLWLLDWVVECYICLLIGFSSNLNMALFELVEWHCAFIGFLSGVLAYYHSVHFAVQAGLSPNLFGEVSGTSPYLSVCSGWLPFAIFLFFMHCLWSWFYQINVHIITLILCLLFAGVDMSCRMLAVDWFTGLT